MGLDMQKIKTLDVKPSNNVSNLFELTDDQKGGLNFLKNCKPGSINLLLGSAGTGKTTLISRFVSELPGCAVTAPTHKAVEVLQIKNPDVSCSTIQSFLCLRPKLVGAKYVFTQHSDLSRISRVKYLIIDEASMIDTLLLKYIEDYLIMCPRCIIIFVGDNKQLNPVGENYSPAFHRSYPQFELTKIVRHDNDIIDLSRNLNWIKEKKSGEHFDWQFKENIDKLIESNGSDYAKFITWTNDTVAVMNNWVRSKLYGDNNDQFYKDETILSIDHFTDGDDVICKNNQEIVITDIDETEILEFKCYMINGEIPILKRFEFARYNVFLDNLKTACIQKRLPWKDYYAFKESFCGYQYNHALTTHRSQGSTFVHSFVNTSEIYGNNSILERNRMLYTAITRASEHNYLR